MEPIKEEEVKETDEFSLEGKEEIISVLKSVPLKLMKKELGIYKLELEKGELISINKTIENDVKRNVAAETEDKEIKGDIKAVKKYTNDLQRESQALSVLMNRKDYQLNRSRADKIDKTVVPDKIALSYMKRVLRSAEALVYIGK